MPGNHEIIRIRMQVTGRVQGVGFRAHVEHHARQVGGITGWVRNVGYDVVEVLAEGERSSLERFAGLVKQGPAGAHVNESQLEEDAATGEFPDFKVRRSL